MAYKCPVCNKVWPNTRELARHILGTGDKPHKDWIGSKGLSFADLLLMGSKGYQTLSELLEREAENVN